MNEYVICTDSCVDLDGKMVEELGVVVKPLSFTIDGKNYANWPDGREMGFKEFYDKLREGASASTSQVNVADFVGSFEPVLEEGKDILYIGFSSGLSGTVNSAVVAAQELADRCTKGKVVVVDSLAASLGQGQMVWHAVQKKRAGMGIDELAAWLEDNKLRFVHWFTVDDLDFLRRGGRLSGAAAWFGSMLNIKPVLHVDDEGHLIAMEKIRGRKQSLNALVDQMEKTVENAAEQYVFISHSDCPEDAAFVADEVKRRFGVKDVYINYIGPVIGSHTGPGTVALFFMGNKR